MARFSIGLLFSVIFIITTGYGAAHLLARGIVGHGGLIVGAVIIAALLLGRNHLSRWLD